MAVLFIFHPIVPVIAGHGLLLLLEKRIDKLNILCSIGTVLLYQGDNVIKYIQMKNLLEIIINKGGVYRTRLPEKEAQSWPEVKFKNMPAHELHGISPANKSFQVCVYSHTPVLMALVSRNLLYTSCPNEFIANLCPFVLMSKLSFNFMSFCFSHGFTS